MDFEARREELESRYKNHKPIVFHYVDEEGMEYDVEVPYNNDNYKIAYNQQRGLLDLEEAYSKKEPIYHITADRNNYENSYEMRKNALLHPEINGNINIIGAVKSDGQADDSKKLNQEAITDSQHGSGSHSEFENPRYVILNSSDPRYFVIAGDISEERLADVRRELEKEFKNDFPKEDGDLKIEIIGTDKLLERLASGEKVPLANTGYVADMASDGTIEFLQDGQKKYYLKPKNKTSVNQNVPTYIGSGRHFKPNNLDLEYATFEKDGNFYIVGNFTKEWVTENYKKLLGDVYGIKIKLYNRLDVGTTPLGDTDLGDIGVKVVINDDGSIEEIIGKVENCYIKPRDLSKTRRKAGKRFKKDVQSNGEQFGQESSAIIPSGSSNDAGGEQSDYEDKDMSGLDRIPPMDNDISQEAVGVIPASAKMVSHKEAKPPLFKRAKEAWGSLKKWQKVAIVAGVIVVVGVGVGVVVIGPHVMDAINNLVSPDNANTVSDVVQSANVVSDTVTTTSSAASTVSSSLDYSSLGGAGQTVFTNAGDAASGVNGVVSNQWFSNNPVDVFNTATNSYMGLTAEQLADPQLMAELAQDPNNAILFGNSVSDPSGFMNLEDVVSTITKVR